MHPSHQKMWIVLSFGTSFITAKKLETTQMLTNSKRIHTLCPIHPIKWYTAGKMNILLLKITGKILQTYMKEKASYAKDYILFASIYMNFQIR